MADDENSGELDLHGVLIRDVLAGGALTRGDALLWMVVLCTQRIVLEPGARGAETEPTELAGHTWRGAADTIARLWRRKKRGTEHPYADYGPLYSDYCDQLSANSISEVPDPRRARVLELRDLLRTHPYIRSVEDEA